MSVLIERLLHAVEAYSMLVPHIQSVILVGSYARGTNHAGSDVDLVLITTDKPGMLKEQGFVPYFGEVLQTQIEYYGACTSLFAHGTKMDWRLNLELLNPPGLQSPWMPEH